MKRPKKWRGPEKPSVLRGLFQKWRGPDELMVLRGLSRKERGPEKPVVLTRSTGSGGGGRGEHLSKIWQTHPKRWGINLMFLTSEKVEGEACEVFSKPQFDQM